MSALKDFHFLYPLWFLLVPLVIVIWWWLSRQTARSQAWQHFIDDRLKPFVISGHDASRSKWFRHFLLMTSLAAILALAGPSWQKRQLPAFQAQQGLVLVLDLSLSMLATDVSPNRINRARFKLLDLLKLRKEGQTGLVVFAGDAFAVSPLTDDVENIIEQAKNLSPGIMPAQGSLIYRGIDEAALLLQQAGYASGDILVIADGDSDHSRTLRSAEASAAMGYRVSVAAIGDEAGGPIPLRNNEFLRDQQGNLIVAGVEVSKLAQIADKGNGLFQEFVMSDDDIEGFQEYFSQDQSSMLDDKKTTVEHWHNEGIWLLWLMLVPLLLLFRKGYLFSIAVGGFILTVLLPQPASALSWDELWLNADQRAHRAMEENRLEEAKDLFETREWKASAAYKNGDFDETASLLEQDQSATGLYNRGNALAKSGKLEDAMKSFEKALAIQSNHEDATFNLDVLKKMQQEQQQQQQGQNQQQDQNQQQQNQDQQGQQNQNGQGQQDPEQNEENQSSEQDKQQQEDADAARKQAEEAAKSREEAAKREAEKKQQEQQAKEAGKEQVESKEMTEEEKEQARQTKQWLHKIPDDSAGLWRRKFQYQYQQRQPRDGAQNSQQGQQW